MPRAIRLKDAGYLHHVVSKGNDPLVLFQDKEDFTFYLSLLEKARSEFPTHIYNYALLDSQIHLLLEPLDEGNLSKFMEMVSKSYARYFNKKYNRTGHVFAGRFKSFVLQAEKHFFSSNQYMVEAAHRAAGVDHSAGKSAAGGQDKQAHHSWCAFCYLAQGKKPPLAVDLHDLYKNLGANDFERQIAYRTLLNNAVEQPIDFDNRRADIMGDREFKDKVRGK